MPIHADPRAWEELPGRCVNAFMERGRDVGVKDLPGLVDYSFGAPSTMWIPPAGGPRGLRPRREGCARRRRVCTPPDLPPGTGPLRAAPHADLEAMALLGLVGLAPAATYAASRLFDRAVASFSLE